MPQIRIVLSSDAEAVYERLISEAETSK